ncbi:AraC family transcriptional regulator [Shinella zoogloeoides]|uniref:Helix-turn-helix domain-containing protein n=1 Tax=Shinella zoogloeoides TaxID=352475 RepID=A0A6N8TCJ7_SHIZO|nr:AraC family transcriptional regulator [Shinella zoogloeoides]MXN98933.1 helix-turn-helix domain-containing protein [Shinella zoogloeoides]UEX83374.1 AraC family transcriptional regulator [Shinella zoogloeoides]
MSENEIWAAYEKRLLRVSAYIYEHLDEDMDLDRLSEIACLSAHHWHRVYRAVHNETLATTVRRLRLHRAAGDLVRSESSVRDIAARWGYPNLQSFTRVFAAAYGMPPARYRREGSHRAYAPENDKETSRMFDVAVTTLPEQRLLCIPHSGSYMGIGKAFEALYGALFSRNIFQPDMRMIGLFLDDPELVAEEKLRSFACVTAGADIPAEAPLVSRTLAGGDYAVLRHKGPYANMGAAYRWLYGTWLPASGRSIRDEVMFEAYLNNPRDVPPNELLTEICLPLQSVAAAA